jgi:predicted  nucleic acid-binding Zn-ribbon protein
VLNVEEELRILNEKATAAYGAYQEQLQTKASLEGENNAMEKEISDLRAKLMEEQVTMLMFGWN